MSNSKLCVSIDVDLFIYTYISGGSFCVSNVKNLQNICKKYTLNATTWRPIRGGDLLDAKPQPPDECSRRILGILNGDSSVSKTN